MDTLMTRPLIRIDGVRVDVDALVGIAHTCIPERCRDRRSCCACYEVCVGKSEMSPIVGCLPQAAKYNPALRDGSSCIDPFEETDEGAHAALATDPDGACVFAYKGTRGETWCALHSAALDLGLRPLDVKPQSCWLWPLALTESKPLVLGVQEDAFSFPCNRRRSRTSRQLHRGIAEIVEAVFGEEFLVRLNEHLAARQHGNAEMA
jgi:hypothetical protein